jgi:hypothetical protein
MHRRKFKAHSLSREIARGRKANPLLGDLLLISVSALGGAAAYWAWLKYGPSATAPTPVEPSGSTVATSSTGEVTTTLPTTTVVGNPSGASTSTGTTGPGVGAAALHVQQRYVPVPSGVNSISMTGSASQQPANILKAGQSLQAGRSLVVGSGTSLVHLDMQGDGNLVLYQGAGTSFPIWASNTAGSGATEVTLQTDGNLVLYPGPYTPGRGGAVSATGTVTNNPTGVLTLAQGGNLYLSNNVNPNYWSASFENLSNSSGPATYG